MKKRTALILTAMAVTIGLFGCGKEPAAKTESTEVKTETEEFSATSLSNEEEILSFIQGDWRFYDVDKNEEFASISFGADGSFSFEREFDKTTCEGNISFKKTYAGESDAPDDYLVSVTDVKVGESTDTGYSNIDDRSTSGGIFYICSAGDTDYLKLEEVGNGDSYVMMELFRNGPNQAPPYERYNRGCMLVRQREKDVKAEGKKNESFTAYAWKRDDEKTLWLQPMISHQRQDYNEFTERRFIGAYFSPETTEAARYELADDLDTSLLLMDKRFESGNPLMMYNFLADESGKIISVSEVDTEIYGAYDLGEGDIEFCINDEEAGDGLMFTYNGINIDLTNMGPANCLLDCTKVGEKILIEGHINPHNSAYYIFDTNSGDFEEQCYGCNFIYHDGDITTAVFSTWDQVYDYAGDLIGWFDEGEIYDLEFVDDNKAVKAVCYRFEGDEEIEEVKTFEIPDTGTRSMYYYADFIVSRRYSAWARFIKDAPEGALGFVIENPPQYMMYRMYNSEVLDEDTDNHLVVAALYDDTVVSVEENGEELMNITLRKGECVNLQVVIPEGIPEKNLKIKANNEELTFPIGQLSGKDPVHCQFLKVTE